MIQTVCDGCHKTLDGKPIVHLTARDQAARGDFEFCNWSCVSIWAMNLQEVKPDEGRSSPNSPAA